MVSSFEILDLPLAAFSLVTTLAVIRVGRDPERELVVLFDPADAASRRFWANTLPFVRHATFLWAPMPDYDDPKSINLSARLVLGGTQNLLYDSMLGYLDPSGDDTSAKNAVVRQSRARDLISRMVFSGQTLPLPCILWRSAQGLPSFTYGVLSTEVVGRIVKDAVQFRSG